MIEIVVRNFLEKAHVIRMPGRLPEIHIGTDMNLNQIRSDLGTEISSDEFEKFQQLYSDDSYPRVFLHGGNYLKITDKK